MNLHFQQQQQERQDHRIRNQQRRPCSTTTITTTSLMMISPLSHRGHFIHKFSLPTTLINIIVHLGFVHFIFLFLFNPGDIHCYETYDVNDQIAEESSASSLIISSIDGDRSSTPVAVSAAKTDVSSQKMSKIVDVNNEQQKRFDCRNRTDRYFPDPQFCDIFHYCKADGNIYTFVCPQGSYYNAQLITCERQNVSFSSSLLMMKNFNDCRIRTLDLERLNKQNSEEMFANVNSNNIGINGSTIGDNMRFTKEKILKMITNISNIQKQKNIKETSNLVVNFLDPPISISSTVTPLFLKQPTKSSSYLNNNNNNNNQSEIYQNLQKLNQFSTTTLIPQSFFLEPTTNNSTTIVPDSPAVASQMSIHNLTREYTLTINHLPSSTTPITNSTSINQTTNDTKIDFNHLNMKKTEQQHQIWMKPKMNQTLITTTSKPLVIFTMSPMIVAATTSTTSIRKLPSHRKTSTNVVGQKNFSSKFFHNGYHRQLNLRPNKNNVQLMSTKEMKLLDENKVPNLHELFKILDMSNFDLSKYSNNDFDYVISSNDISSIPQNNYKQNSPNISGMEELTNHNNKFSLSIHKFIRESVLLPTYYLKNVPRFLKNLNFINNNSNNKFLQQVVNNGGNYGSDKLSGEYEMSMATSKNLIQQRQQQQQQVIKEKFDPIKVLSKTVELNDHDPVDDNYLISNMLMNVVEESNKKYENVERNHQVTNTKINMMEPIDVDVDDSIDNISMLSIPVLVPANLTQHDYRQRMSASLLRPVVIPLREKGKLVPAYVLQFSNNYEHGINRFKRSSSSNNNNNGNVLGSNLVANMKDNNKKLLNFPIKSNLLINLIPSLLKNKLMKSSKLQSSSSSSIKSTVATNPKDNLNSMMMVQSAILPTAYYQKQFLTPESYLSYVNQMLKAENNQIYDLKDFSNNNQFLSPYYFTSLPDQHQHPFYQQQQSSQTLYPAQSYKKFLKMNPPNLYKLNENKTGLMTMGSVLDSTTVSDSSLSSMSQYPGGMSYSSLSFDYGNPTVFSDSKDLKNMKQKLSKNLANINYNKISASFASNANVYVPDELFEDFQVFKPSIDVNGDDSTKTSTVTTSPEMESNESNLIQTYAGIKDALNRYNGRMAKKVESIASSSTSPTSTNTTLTTEKPVNYHQMDNKNMIIINYANGTTLRIAGKKNQGNGGDLINDKDRIVSAASTVTASMMVAPTSTFDRLKHHDIVGAAAAAAATTTTTTTTTSTTTTMTTTPRSSLPILKYVSEIQHQELPWSGKSMQSSSNNNKNINNHDKTPMTRTQFVTINSRPKNFYGK